MLRILACILPLTLGAWAAPSRAQPVPETQVKAAYLYRFLSFVEWPARALTGAEREIVVGVMGADEVHDELARIAGGRTVQERTVVVRRLLQGDSLSGVHLLFAGRSLSHRLASLSRAGAPWMLVVAESEHALDAGAVVNFVAVDGRIRFEVAPGRATEAGLRISSRMLAVAHRVVDGK